MENKLKIRTVIQADVVPMLEIYTPYVLNSGVSFETLIPTIDEFWKRIQLNTKTYPWMVAEIDGTIAGYAYAGQYRARAAYQWNVEVSVYVSSKYHRSGVARKLYENLIENLKIQGFRNLYAIITLPNDPSTKFHESMGFKYFCVFKNVGFKLNRWHDVGWWVLDLINKNETIEPPTPFK